MPPEVCEVLFSPTSTAEKPQQKTPNKQTNTHHPLGLDKPSTIPLNFFSSFVHRTLGSGGLVSSNKTILAGVDFPLHARLHVRQLLRMILRSGRAGQHLLSLWSVRADHHLMVPRSALAVSLRCVLQSAPAKER